MNSTSLFNFSYLKENIKKSKAIILLCILLLPIINGIILLMNCSLDNGFMPNIYELSGVVLFGMYIVPIVLSITLFSFVYKKGSIDFTLSMPIIIFCQLICLFLRGLFRYRHPYSKDT